MSGHGDKFVIKLASLPNLKKQVQSLLLENKIRYILKGVKVNLIKLQLIFSDG